MVRFLHTADLQLGKPYAWLQGDAAAALRRVRMDALARVLAVARQEAAAFVVIAGDLFDANTVGSEIVAQACRIIGDAGIAVYVIPGNHDHGGSDSVFEQPAMETYRPDNLHLLLTGEAVAAADGAAVLLPAPLLRRHEYRDVTTHLTADTGRDLAPDAVRIAVAHGSITDFGGTSEASNEIDPRLVERAGLDYLALGDWHGLFQVGPRAWYSGTPEPDRFKDNDPGKVLLVECDGPGSPPQVTPIETATYRWLSHQVTLRGTADLDALQAFVAAIPDPRHSLLRLDFDGALSMSEHARLLQLLQHAEHHLLHLRKRGAGVVAMPSPEELADLQLDGYLGAVVAELRAAAGSPADRAPDADARTAARALDLLYRLHQEVSR